jgi:bifunctional non-homologous end joining protein LigD
MVAFQRTSARVGGILEQLNGGGDRLTVTIDGHEIALTGLDARLWPSATGRGVTKRDFLRYLTQVSPYLLGHLKDRPVEIARCPDGIGGETVFGAEGFTGPAFVRTIELSSCEREGAVSHLLVSDLATLLWLGQCCALELFAWMARIEPRAASARPPAEAAGDLSHPDFLVVNLDWRRTVRPESAPDDPADRLAFRRVADVAYDVRSVASALGLRAFVKTSGRRGLHCLLPVGQRQSYAEVRVLAEMIGQFLSAVRPRSSTRTMALLARSGYIAIDHHHNGWGKVVVAPYAPRRHPSATVSMPLDWSELETAYPTDFTIHTVPEILAARGDPWAELLRPAPEGRRTQATGTDGSAGRRLDVRPDDGIAALPEYHRETGLRRNSPGCAPVAD